RRERHAEPGPVAAGRVGPDSRHPARGGRRPVPRRDLSGRGQRPVRGGADGRRRLRRARRPVLRGGGDHVAASGRPPRRMAQARPDRGGAAGRAAARRRRAAGRGAPGPGPAARPRPRAATGALPERPTRPPAAGRADRWRSGRRRRHRLPRLPPGRRHRRRRRRHRRSRRRGGRPAGGRGGRRGHPAHRPEPARRPQRPPARSLSAAGARRRRGRGRHRRRRARRPGAHPVPPRRLPDAVRHKGHPPPPPGGQRRSQPLPDLRRVVKGLLPFIVIGVTTGAVYALASMGLVVTYTTSGVFNFAHGAVGMFATFVFNELRAGHGWPTPLAVAVAVLVVAPLLGIAVDRLLLGRLQGAPAATYVVVSLGLLVALQSAAVAIFGGQTRQVPPLFPSGSFSVAGVRVGYDQACVIAIALLVAVALAAFFRFTHLGLQTLAVVGDRDLTELVGTNARAVTTFSWVLGACFAALSGVLFAPVVGLDAVLLTLLVVQAFGAAVVGRLRSLPLTNLGAYGIAIAAAVATKYAATSPTLVGLPSSLPFIVLFGVLVASPRGFFAEIHGEGRVGRSTAARPAPAWRSLGAGMTVAAVLPAVLSGSRLLTATTTVIFVAIFASLSLLVGLSKQVSLCHAVFAVFGATTLSHLLKAGLPYPMALLLSAAVLVPLGALVSLPAIRLSGLFLALATFGFGILAQSLLFNSAIAFGRRAQVNLPRPSWFGGDVAFYYFALAVVV